MTKPAVSKEDIFQAIQDLVSRGESPISTKVRVQLGDRGSANTILRGIHEWYAEHGELMVKAITNPSLIATENIKKAIKQAADQAFNTFTHEYKAHIAKLTTDQQAVAATLKEVERQAQEHAAIIPFKDERIADLQARNTEIIDERDFARTGLKLEEDAHRATMAKSQEDAATAQTSIAVLKTELEASQKQLKASEDNLQLSQQDRIKISEQKQQLEKTIEQLQGKLETSTQQFDDLKVSSHAIVQAKNESIKTLQTELDDAKKLASAQEKNHHAILTALKLLDKNQESSNTSLLNHQKTIESLVQKSTKANQQTIDDNLSPIHNKLHLLVKEVQALNSQAQQRD